MNSKLERDIHDIEFLKEMKRRLQEAIDYKDVTQFEFVKIMIDDWIDEPKITQAQKEEDDEI